jgi:hypothetical protein
MTNAHEDPCTTYAQERRQDFGAIRVGLVQLSIYYQGVKRLIGFGPQSPQYNID